MDNRRRIKVINQEFQYNFMLKTVLAVIISLNTVIFTVYMLDRHFGLPGTIFNVFSASLLLMEVSAVAIVSWIGRDISFHIAGPVYAIERTLKGMLKGDLSQRLHLREGDNFLETADTLNLMLETYQNRIVKLRELVSQVELSEEDRRILTEELEWFRTQKAAPQAPSQAASDETIGAPADWQQQRA